MFSIAAINDTDSKCQWEPLAPTKEAQEFHLSQTYHEGLVKLQAKEYEKARELLESVLKDPLIANAQVDRGAGDSHLLQLRFLALKNLAAVFLQQGSTHYENALHCYLQAVEIDSKDSVVWNQLGTLSCSMGSLSISRWAFEQGLLCSPNNWNCMEKLLEVLIAIGDEVACLSVAELILRHWPSHSRALHVRNTIEESEPLPFASRGIDKLEPKHVRLKFPDKRKANNENLDDDVAFKKLNQNKDLYLSEASWVALADALLEILLPSNLQISEVEHKKTCNSPDIKLRINLPCSSEAAVNTVEVKGLSGEDSPFIDGNVGLASDFKDKEANTQEEQPHERRSSRLERLRSRKPGKEESSFCGKDPAKIVIRYLEPFIAGGLGDQEAIDSDTTTLSSAGNSEYDNVSAFLRQTSNNYGAYHLGHLLLEEVSRQGLPFQDAFVKFLELEKLTRHWGKDRTAECNIFLAELYYDFGLCSPTGSKRLEWMSEASYHLCKIVESVALDYPFHLTSALNEGCNLIDGFPETSGTSINTSTENNADLDSSLLMKNSSFWSRFYWLSGRLSIFEGNKAKACEEFCIALSLLAKREKIENSPGSIPRPHCKDVKEINIDRVLYEVNILKVNFLMEKSIISMMEQEKYFDCVSLLSPLLFSTQDVYFNSFSLSMTDKKDEKITSIELRALDVLIEACQKTMPMDVDLYFNCHYRKLKILMALMGLNTSITSFKSSDQTLGFSGPSNLDTDSSESSSKQCSHLVAEEVKALSDCISQVKKVIDQCGDSDGLTIPTSSLCQMQSLLLLIMSYVANVLVCNNTSAQAISDQVESSCFVDAAIVFCKLQHLSRTTPIKTQVDLIVATHDMLAEYELCCVGKGGKGGEGTFLRFAIKHLLALDMKFKSSSNLKNKESMRCEEASNNNIINVSMEDSRSDTSDFRMDWTRINEITSVKKEVSEEVSKSISSCKVQNKDGEEEECENHVGAGTDCELVKGESSCNQLIECGNELSEDEREELESIIDSALDQCFFCLYGLNLKSDSSYEDDLVMHKNSSRGDYQTKEQCADVFKYVLPYAKASSKTGLVKLRRVLRAIRKHFLQPPEDLLTGNPIDKFLDDPNLCEDKLSEEAGSEGFLETITKTMFPDVGGLGQYNTTLLRRSEPYLDVYCNLYHFLALSEEMSATDKWPGFVLTKEGEEFVEQNAKLFKYDLMYNPLRFDSWQRLGNIYDEEVDLLLNDGSKHINVVGWRKNPTLSERVETSRRRSRRCLLMSLALAKTSAQQCEIHELLALVYYDSLQNVVPFYDQRSVLPSKDAAWMAFCENSMKHFKKAFALQQDWLHAFYLGKLSEKLEYSHEIALSYYNKAIALNTSAVDPVYRMHASRLKLLFKCGKQNVEILKVLSANSFDQSVKEAVTSILGSTDTSLNTKERVIHTNYVETKHEGLFNLDTAWSMLYNDCLSALETCVEGELKHFHKARYMLAQGLYRRGESGDIERAKDQLSFCFKSSRSSFTINMWEIDSMAKKGRRKTPGSTGNKKGLEVNLPESSRKFITCIRKYVLFYLKLLEETGDRSILERAYVSLRGDKRFSLCIEDLVPVAIGKYLKALISTMRHSQTTASPPMSSSDNVLERMFALFMEQGSLWPEICSLPEIECPDTSESLVYGYLHEHIALLEINGKLETLETINEKIRKRFKNPKLSNSCCAKVCQHASVALCRSLIYNLAQITPISCGFSNGIQVHNLNDDGMENSQLRIDLQPRELWITAFEDPSHLEKIETKWSAILSKIRDILIKKASDENLETANTLFRACYHFYRESSSVVLTSGLNFYVIPAQLVTVTPFDPTMTGVEALDLSIPRKLLLWAYALVHGRYANISVVVKHCEEISKSKMKRGSGTSPALTNNSPALTNNSPATVPTLPGSSRSGTNDVDSIHVTTAGSGSLYTDDIQKNLFGSPQLHQCTTNDAEKSNVNAREAETRD